MAMSAEREILALEIPCDASAPGTVRDALGELEWLGWVLGDVILVASELVANAVTHSGGSPDDRLCFTATLASGRLRIAVSDPGRTDQVAHLRESGGMTEGGWGLLIVDQLATAWGQERLGNGPDAVSRVWADLALPPEQATAEVAQFGEGRGEETTAAG